MRVTGELATTAECVYVTDCLLWQVLTEDGAKGWIQGGHHHSHYSPFLIDGSYSGDFTTRFDLSWAGGSFEWYVSPGDDFIACDEIEASLDNVVDSSLVRLYDGSYEADAVAVPIPFSENYRVGTADSIGDGWAYRIDGALELCPELRQRIIESVGALPIQIEEMSTPERQASALTKTPAIMPTATVAIQPTIFCPGALPTRLSIGESARTTNYQVNVRSGPGTGNPLVNRLVPGRLVEVLQGPECVEGHRWYYILSEEVINSAGERIQVDGWVVEEDDGTWLLEPAD